MEIIFYVSKVLNDMVEVSSSNRSVIELLEKAVVLERLDTGVFIDGAKRLKDGSLHLRPVNYKGGVLVEESKLATSWNSNSEILFDCVAGLCTYYRRYNERCRFTRGEINDYLLSVVNNSARVISSKDSGSISDSSFSLTSYTELIHSIDKHFEILSDQGRYITLSKMLKFCTVYCLGSDMGNLVKHIVNLEIRMSSKGTNTYTDMLCKLKHMSGEYKEASETKERAVRVRKYEYECRERPGQLVTT